MKPRTEEFLYLMLWTFDRFARPSFRNFEESFEGWAYRRGYRRQLAELERRQLLEGRSVRDDQRVHRLTELGWLHAVGGRDPEAFWTQPWDGRWRLVLFDLPAKEETTRSKLRHSLQRQGFGWIQRSVWITPRPLDRARSFLKGSDINVKSLLVMEARPVAGETDEQIVAGAWNFNKINEGYSLVMEILRQCPPPGGRTATQADVWRRWGVAEREAWLAAVQLDPLLPACLHPGNYLGSRAWELRKEVLRQAGRQVAQFVW